MCLRMCLRRLKLTAKVVDRVMPSLSCVGRVLLCLLRGVDIRDDEVAKIGDCVRHCVKDWLFGELVSVENGRAKVHLLSGNYVIWDKDDVVLVASVMVQWNTINL